MKATLLLIICCAVFAFAKANDTLTNAQIYSFNVGDTFQYRYASEDIDHNQPLTYSYSWLVLMQKTYSPNLDTLYLDYGPPGGGISTRESISDLDSFPILRIPPPEPGCTTDYTFDTTTYPGYSSNELAIRCFESGSSYRFTNGLGQTLSGWGHVGYIGYGTVASERELIYYANGTTHVGTPYIPPPPVQTIYIPLPETCAVWTRSLHGSYNGYLPYGTITEQIRTGGQIQKDGKTYVELICRIRNDITNRYTPDSLIGYFYNNPANLGAFFVTDTNQSPFYALRFTGQPGQQCSFNGYYSVSSILLGGVLRTYWACSGPDDCSEAKISGIGRLSGLLYINRLYDSPGHETCGTLTSFCVCGQKIYATDSSATCDLISGITALDGTNQQLTIFPNPVSGQLTINGNQLKGSAVAITNIAGQPVFKTRIEGEDSKIDLHSFAPGIYMLTVTYPHGDAITKKLVVQNCCN